MTMLQLRGPIGSCVLPWWLFIAVDTLCHQPMGASHMTMLQLRGPIGSCVLPWWLFIAVDTLCQHPMRTGHMTVLQSCGLMEFHVPQWCHPMLASTRRTGCCTRIITLYGTRKWIQARTNPSLFYETVRACLRMRRNFLAKAKLGMLHNLERLRSCSCFQCHNPNINWKITRTVNKYM